MSENPEMLDIEIDHFVSPNAATDVPPDDFIPLDLDDDLAPVADAPVAPVADASDVPNALASLADDLAAISAQASVEGPIASGSLTSGTMAYVGFTSAAGYVTALAHGVKAGTAASYKQTLRQWMTQADIDALPVVIIPEGDDRPLDAAPTVVTHDGPDIFEARRIARGLAPEARLPVARHIEARPGALANPDIEESVMIPEFSVVVEGATTTHTGLSLHYGPAELANHEIPRAFLVETLETNGFGNLAPGIKTGKAQFGKVMKSLNSVDARDSRGDVLRLKSWAVTRKDAERLAMEWPESLESRYCVGHLDATPELGHMGEKVLVCSLFEVTEGTYELRFTGGTDAMRQAVTSRFESLNGTASLDVTDLVNWYKATLASAFGAVRQGFKMLIVGNAGDANLTEAERFCNVLQGSNVYGASPIMGRRLDCDYQSKKDGGATWNKFCINVGAGLVADAKAVGKEFEKAYAQAMDRERAKEIAREGSTVESQDLAARRALILRRRAATLIATLTALQTRATGSVGLIGQEHANPAIQACEEIRAAWLPKCENDFVALDMD